MTFRLPSDFDKLAFEAHLVREGLSRRTVDLTLRVVARWRRSRLEAKVWLERQQDASRGRTADGRPTATAKSYEVALRRLWRYLGRDIAEIALPRTVRYSRPGEQRALAAWERGMGSDPRSGSNRQS